MKICPREVWVNQGHDHTLHREHTHSHLSSRHRCMEHSLAMSFLKCDFGFGRCSDTEWSTPQNPVLFSIPVQGVRSSSRCTCRGTLSIPSRGAVYCIPPRNRMRTRAGLWTPLLPVYYKAECPAWHFPPGCTWSGLQMKPSCNEDIHYSSCL